MGKKEDHEVKSAHLYDRIDDLEQYSRRNCLLFVGIEERDDEDKDALVLDVCTSELEYHWKALRGLIGWVLEYTSKESGVTMQKQVKEDSRDKDLS